MCPRDDIGEIATLPEWVRLSSASRVIAGVAVLRVFRAAGGFSAGERHGECQGRVAFLITGLFHSPFLSPSTQLYGGPVAGFVIHAAGPEAMLSRSQAASIPTSRAWPMPEA